MTVACSNEVNEMTPQQANKSDGMITITAQLAPKTNESDTRAVADNNDGKITVTWATNEHLAILYEVGNEKKVADATITDVDGEGTATIQFTVDDNTTDGTACTIVYPLSAAKADNTGVKAYADMLATQDGVLDGDLDVRVGSGTINVTDPSLAVTTQPEAQYAIFKFTLGAAIDATHPLVIKDVNDNVITTVTPASSTSEVYVAQESASEKFYKFSATTADNKIISKSGKATIVAGKYYQTTLACPALGDLYYSDGTYSTTLQTGKTAIGVIGYLGTDNYTENGTVLEDNTTFVGHGLVMCLKDASSGAAWSTQGRNKGYLTSSKDERIRNSGSYTDVACLTRSEYVSGYYYTKLMIEKNSTQTEYQFRAAAAAKNYTGLPAPATGTTGWFLPTIQQWVRLQLALGGLTVNVLRYRSKYDSDLVCVTNWQNAMAKAGASAYDPMVSDDQIMHYWSSTEVENQFQEWGASMSIYGERLGNPPGFYIIYNGKGSGYRVRPFLAF
ncbi:MAG: hypothetical protein K6D37_07355, partial [Prevotella sp.]|nr:hypothetical protein [Prevotella sp.]